jgi:pullulanase/glycogen debranching enzyme
MDGRLMDPDLWAEWNGQYRDTVRASWKGDEGQAGALGYRLTGSSDLYGKEMTEEDWTNSQTRCLGLRLAGDAIEEVDAQGEPIRGDTLLIFLNAHHEPVPFILPAHRPGVKWELLLDTRTPEGRRLHRPMKGGEAYSLEGRCLAVLQLRRK